jgi:hypothetical protein
MNMMRHELSFFNAAALAGLSCLALAACGGASSLGSVDGGGTTDGGTIDTGTTSSGAWVDRTQGTGGSGQLWTGVASDAAGAHLVAASTLVIPPGRLVDGVWTSSDASQTWAVTSLQTAGLSAVASSSTGTVLVAIEGLGDSGGSIWTSTDSGATWSNTSSPSLLDSWGGVASDSTGTHLVAGAAFGDIWTSSDSGATWIDQTASGPAHGQNWVSIASDSTGANLVAVAGGGIVAAGPGATGDIWTSSDSGVTWTDRTSSGPAHDLSWGCVASDSTGNNLVAVGSGIWTSADAGITWTQQTSPSSTGSWVSVASDTTGTRLIAASGQIGGTGDLWTSVDSGVTWTNETAGTSAAEQAWSGVASDATGAHLVAVVRGGDIWTN